MKNEKLECYKILDRYKFRLPQQDYRTLRGQIRAGDIKGFKKGIQTVSGRINRRAGDAHDI